MYRQSGKDFFSSSMSSTCPHNMVNFGPLAAEIGLPVGYPCKFQRLSRLGSITARQSSSECQPNFAALNRGRHLCSAGRPSGWALAHISSYTCAKTNCSTLWNRAGHYIFMLWFLSLFPRLISAVGDWMSTILPHMVCTLHSLSVNLECRSETCCARLVENTARKKSPKSRHLGTTPKLCRAVS